MRTTTCRWKTRDDEVPAGDHSDHSMGTALETGTNVAKTVAAVKFMDGELLATSSLK